MQNRTSRYQNEEITGKRSEKNKDLYNKIYQDAEYSNIENIANMEKTNEIDLQKIREMLNRGEDKKEVEQIISKPKEKEAKEEIEHDIKKILDKARDKREEIDPRRKSLGDTNYNILKNLRIDKYRQENKKEDLQEIIDKMSSTKILNNLNTQELSEKILSDIAGESTKPVKIEERVDKSFYTTGMKFNEKDFEEKKALTYLDDRKKLKKADRLATIALIVIIVVMLGLLYVIFSRIVNI